MLLIKSIDGKKVIIGYHRKRVFAGGDTRSGPHPINSERRTINRKWTENFTRDLSILLSIISHKMDSTDSIIGPTIKQIKAKEAIS